MADMMTVKEASERWGISVRRVSLLCSEGRIPGVRRQGNRWMIPADAEKPADRRVKNGVYKVKTAEKGARLPLPVGISDYRVASTEYYYVDKTQMIKDFLDERPAVSLFTRPRRFGKTLNMDMLRTFFEKTEEDTACYFTDKKIWACGQKYREYQGKYPVIFISFKDVKKETWQETYEQICQIIRLEFKRHEELSVSRNNGDYDFYEKVILERATRAEMESSLLMLSKMLHEYHGTAPVIIIDEYDTPIQQGHMCDFYDKIVLFMRNLFSGGLKDNRHLSFGFLTGILRVAKESIFSGLNNLRVNSVLDDKYSEYFGFTPEEVREIASYYHAEDKYEELCGWYDGYHFGRSEIFNPWSVINYFSNGCQARAYWQSTGNNEVIGEVLAGADREICDKLRELMQGESFLTYVDTGVIYPEVQENPSSVFSFLLMAGYLNALTCEVSFGGDFMCRVALPNREISYVYQKEIMQRFSRILPQSIAIPIQEAIFAGDAAKLKEYLRKILLRSVSSFDAAGENFYHGFMLGLCTLLGDVYLTSNRESGDGRYDIQMKPRTNRFPGVLIELKAAKNCTPEKLRGLSAEALNQINRKNYDEEMRRDGVTDIVKYGVAFCGKNVEVSVG